MKIKMTKEMIAKSDVIKKIDEYVRFAKKKERKDETLNAVECLGNLKEDIRELDQFAIDKMIKLGYERETPHPLGVG